MPKVEIDAEELDRLKAENRGYIMAKCFKAEKNVFKLFVAAINDPATKTVDPLAPNTKWKIACDTAGLTDGQNKWLWNYLKEYKKELAWNQPAAMNGW